MSTFEEICAVLDKIISSHKECIKNCATEEQLLRNGGEMIQTIDPNSPCIQDLQKVGMNLINCFKCSTEETMEIVGKYSRQQKIFFLKMFEAKLLEAQGYSKSKPADFEAIILISSEKLRKLTSFILEEDNKMVIS